MMKTLFEKSILFPISLYLRHSPRDTGKKFLINSSRELLNKTIKELTVCSKDNMKFLLHFPEDWGLERIYFYRNWETGTTNLLKKILKQDDVVFDIGANIGWYTILFTKLLTTGKCHSFEPVPWIYNKLKVNCLLNNIGNNVYLNQLAVGQTKKNIEIYTFSGLPHGHSSISALGRDDFNISKTAMITLDEYINTKKIDKVDLIKCDVEGAELEVLEGSKTLLSRKVPPMWLFEMNINTCKAFSYTPVDILNFLMKFHDYEFYRIKGAWEQVIPMNTIYDYEHGDNVLCIVPELHRSRLASN